jgi:hypothetical protein
MIQSQFEHRLLVELRQVVAERPAPGVVPLPGAHRRRPLLFAGTATAAVAATAALLILTSGGVAPAFAVDRQTNGDVTVTINQLSDAQGLQSQLRAAGINAEVDYTPAGKACRQPRGRTAQPPNGGPGTVGVRMTSNGGSSTFTVSRNMVGPGQTLVIATSGGTGPSSVGMQVIGGPVSPCVLVDAPGVPAGPAFSTHGQFGGNSARPVTRSSQKSGPALNRVP